MRGLQPSEHSSTPARLLYPRAAQSEIVRAHQKDVYYRDQFYAQVKEVASDLLGSRRSHVYGEVLSLAASVAYFGLSTLGGAQSLGEEYVNAMMRYRPSGKIVDGKVCKLTDPSGARFLSHFTLLHHLLLSKCTALYACLSRAKTSRLSNVSNAS